MRKSLLNFGTMTYITFHTKLQIQELFTNGCVTVLGVTFQSKVHYFDVQFGFIEYNEHQVLIYSDEDAIMNL